MKTDLIYGIHSVNHTLERATNKISKLFLSTNRHDERLQKIIRLAASHSIAVEYLSTKELDHMVDGENHQGVIAKIFARQHFTEHDLENILEALTTPALLLILDGITDPHNLGACLRSADAAGVHAVIAPKDRAATLTPTAIKIASGAAESVPFIQVTNLARTLRYLKEEGIWLYGAAGEAKTSIYNVDMTPPLGLVMGSEDKGLRRLTRENCDDLFYIPMAGSVTSLNVSVATGICLFEAIRQRVKK